MNIASHFKGTKFELTMGKDGGLTVALLSKGGERVKSKAFEPATSKRMVRDIEALIDKGQGDMALSVLWACLGYARKGHEGPLASTVCHPGFRRVA